ncbi:TPA: LOW QUALITY PROTEIN: hypothetical protein N0F65_003624 [Lagenidium giganteum]|uniref:PiggyBac transposable element-derived protein domain-containing protein n=1 Tax=Lagenidium giganteum TaxID=4803 RepID=A0AAV2Z7S9_9STRA|nr:TPA: LOW QUALITY PROTEIN: hypothetical protein N0F65_003624 [Lagenidium giganteum]
MVVGINFGDRVVGKSAKTRGKRGVVEVVVKEKRQHSYDVLWDDGQRERIAARSLALETSSNATTEVPTLPMASFSTNEAFSCDSSSEEDDKDVYFADAHGATALGSLTRRVECIGRTWEKCDDVLDEPAAAKKHETKFKWPEVLALGSKAHAKYFYLMFPMEYMVSLDTPTRTLIQHVKPTPRPVAGSSFCDGVRPMKRDFREYWNEGDAEHDDDTRSVDTPRRFGTRFGMSRRRFETLTAAFCLHDPDDTNEDPWFPVRDFICAFNKRRNDVVHAGTYLCVDESMVQWYGTEVKYHHLGLPHKTKNPRKPMSQGAEIKPIAVAESGVLVGIELVERKLRQRDKQFTHQFGEGTAITLRLTSPFYGSRRIVVGDSAFASVKTLAELERRGLYFMELVKTALSGYPKQHMVQRSATARRGDAYVMRNESPFGTMMYALRWSDRKPKCIIANRGTTAPGNDSIRTRHKIVRHGDGTSKTVRFTLQVRRPHMVEKVFAAFSAVDVHNHYRQGSLSMEKGWPTKTWWHRVFGSVFGMIITDAFMAYKHENVHTDSDSFGEFLSKLAWQQIFNEYISNRKRSRIQSDLETKYAHARENNGRAQRKCKMCGKKCAFICSTCSISEENHFFPLCSSISKRKCHAQHMVQAK